MVVALFDADGTLYSAQFGRGLMKYAWRQGRRMQAAAYFASLVPTLLASKVRLGDPEAFDIAKIEKLGLLLKDWTEAEAMRAFDWVTNEYLLLTRRPQVIERLRGHQGRGHVVVIISGTFTPSLQLLGNRLGVTELVGTQIEMKNGRYTGRIIPPVIKGQDKVEGARKHLWDRKVKVDWPAAYAYGDSYSDRDLLRLVGHPVAVHPDAQLRALAQSQNWELLEES